MAKFSPWKHSSTNSVHDVENPSVAFNRRASADEATGSTHTARSHTLSRIKLGCILVALSVAIVVGIALGRSSGNMTDPAHQKQELQSGPSRIIGGSETQISEYQYAVSIQDSVGAHQCGGSLIADDIILTAAHCQGLTSVVLGRHNLSSSEGESILIKMEILHAEYNNTTADNDLMLILLERPTTIDLPFVQLNMDSNSPRIGENVTVMGWGDMNVDLFTFESSDVLMSVDINVISNEDCNNSSGIILGEELSYNGKITENMLCAADKGQDSCQADSGGPLVIQGMNGDSFDDVLVGVVSWGFGCGLPDFPGVYARISQSYDWIEHVVCSQSSNPPSDFSCGDISTLPSPISTNDDSDDVDMDYSMSMSGTDEFPYMVTDWFDSLDSDGGNSVASTQAASMKGTDASTSFATDVFYNYDDSIFK